MDVAVVRRPDKGVDRDVIGHVGDVPAEHLADAQIAEKDRRAERNRAEALGFEQKRVARDMLAEDRQVLASFEAALGPPRDGARHHPDIAPRQQGFETGNRAREKPRLDHPKHRLVGQQRLGLAGRGDGHNDMSVVGREFCEALDHAKDDVLELELRLARLQPFGAVEGDGNRRPFL